MVKNSLDIQLILPVIKLINWVLSEEPESLQQLYTLKSFKKY